MKTKLLAVALALTFAAAQANAMELVAGWDFSQYFGPNLLSIDGATFTDTLSANYSAQDPNGAGSESAAFGAMFVDGSHGSHDTPLDGSDLYVPLSGNLASNADAAVPPFGSGGACTILTTEGQTFCNEISMVSNGATSPVFVADLTSISLFADNWELSLGAKTVTGTSEIEVEVSTDGVSYAPVQLVAIDAVDKQYIVPLGSALNGEDVVYVRLGLDNVSGAPVIDNLALSGDIVPEPGTVLLMMAGLAGLGVYGRRRS